jgi:hypothetical protein
LQGFQSLCRITKDEGGASFQGAKFLSARTVLIWDENGGAGVYYFGSNNDLKNNSLDQLQGAAVVLLSDGDNAIFVDSLQIGPYTQYS